MSTTMNTTVDVENIRKDFPILQNEQNGKRLIFLDSAASSQRPSQVINAMNDFYEQSYANVHRGVYQIAEQATNKYEQARKSVASFIGGKENEIVFTKNATEAINLVAQTWGKQNLAEGDVVVLSMLEHHANIVPWQILQQEKGIVIRWIPLTAEGELDLSDLDSILTDAKLLSVTAMSNAFGTLTPLPQLLSAAKKQGALTLVDACQSVPHQPTDVISLGADFIAFSGHKMLGPSGIGVLWAKSELLEAMPPFLGGGGMILNVTTEGFTTATSPGKFEAGTPPIAEAVGLHAAIEYLSNIGMEKIHAHEKELTAYALDVLPAQVGPSLKILGPQDPKKRGGVLSLELQDVHAHDISQILNEHAVCVRPGHHCAKPLMKHFGITATARASFYLYNGTDDIDALAHALVETNTFFTRS